MIDKYSRNPIGLKEKTLVSQLIQLTFLTCFIYFYTFFYMMTIKYSMTISHVRFLKQKITYLNHCTMIFAAVVTSSSQFLFCSLYFGFISFDLKQLKKKESPSEWSKCNFCCYFFSASSGFLQSYFAVLMEKYNNFFGCVAFVTYIELSF